MRKINVVVLGSTGSIGCNAVRILKDYPEVFNCVGLVARNNVNLLSSQGHDLGAKWICSTCSNAEKKLLSISPLTAKPEMISELICAPEVDVVLCAIVGTAGLPLVIKALEHGKKIALASKEVLVMAGDLVMKLTKGDRERIIPVDSEHSAIFQCLSKISDGEVERLILTASGGAFKNATAAKIASATWVDAMKHPTWQMGRKVTIDSASLMNKALEFIEAGYLFNFPASKIKAVIHPQSIVHSMVEMCDGTVMAQLSMPDMRFAIGYALSYPQRLEGRNLPRLNWQEIAKLEFSEIDRNRFPAIDFAEEALKLGGTLPAVLNAANEVAVERFVRGEIKLPGIWKIVEKTMSAHQRSELDNVNAAISASNWAEKYAETIMV